MTVYLTFDDLMAIGEAAVGHAVEVRDHGLVESALYRPRSSAFGADAYPSLALKAAALLHSLATNHAPLDGNKRTAMVAVEVFLGMNGGELPLSNDEGRDLALNVANGVVASVEEIAKRLGQEAV